MVHYVKVSLGTEIINLPVEEDNTLLLSTLRAQFPGVSGLTFKSDSQVYGLKLHEGRIYPPGDEWGEKLFECAPSKNFTKTEDEAAAEPEKFNENEGRKKRAVAGSLLEARSEVPSKKKKFSRPGNAFNTLLKKSHFVDKSSIIRKIIDFLELKETETIESPIAFFAPRRFGKTSILDLLESFFGGQLSKDTFMNLEIKNDAKALLWYNRFTVIFVTFGHCKDIIKTRDDCISSCRIILHYTFRVYSFVLDHLEPKDQLKFHKWTDDDYETKNEEEVLGGLRFLIECILVYEKKEICLLIDEFDKMCSLAMYNTSKDNLKEIMDFYYAMVSRVVKFDPIVSVSIFCGITPITCRAHSSLNNLINIEFLNNHPFCESFGITETEFENIMARESIPLEVKSQKVEALRWYNGYVYKNMKILNTYSVAYSIILRKVQSFWNRSGFATGLWQALHSDSIRNEIFDLMNDTPLLIEVKELYPEDFCLCEDGRYEVLDYNLIFTFLLQQGYLTKTETNENGKILVQIPNKEIKGVYVAALQKYYIDIYKFDTKKINDLYNLFRDMKFSSVKDVKKKLTNFKNILVELLRNEKEEHNEAWFEGFLFAIFLQSTDVRPQLKVKKTAIRNDMRTAKVLDLYVKMTDRYLIFEETLVDTGEGALKKLIEKQYYKQLESTSPFMLIGIGIHYENKQFDVSIAFLVNEIDLKKIVKV